MARFLGSVQGARGKVSRLGNPSSGLVVKANGWDLGVEVHASTQDGVDVFDVVLTGGSNESIGPMFLVRVREIPKGGPGGGPGYTIERA